jgi:hypothetical protein
VSPRNPGAAKDKSIKRIDGIVALIMAIGRALVAPRGAGALLPGVRCLGRDTSNSSSINAMQIGIETVT